MSETTDKSPIRWKRVVIALTLWIASAAALGAATTGRATFIVLFIPTALAVNLLIGSRLPGYRSLYGPSLAWCRRAFASVFRAD